MSDGRTTAQKLIALIERDGAIPLGDYMAIANSDYYASRVPIGAGGDFITAPEISQMFGELVGLWLTDLWSRAGSPADAHYVELGPGRGTLAVDALRAMAQFGFAPSVHLVENSPTLRAEQQRRLTEACWHEDISTLPETGPLLIVANEFFDALPVQQLVRQNGSWHRQMVVRDRNRFRLTVGEEAVAGGAPPLLPDGSIFEYSPASRSIMGDLSARLAAQGGVLLVIDYGHARPGTGSTLQAVKNQLPVSPFDDPGNADLTVHVNFYDLGSIAHKHLLSVHGPVEQGQWLTSLGIGARAQALIRTEPQRQQEVEAALHRLTHVDEMGRLFRVMAATPLGWPEPEGFVY